VLCRNSWSEVQVCSGVFTRLVLKLFQSSSHCTESSTDWLIDWLTFSICSCRLHAVAVSVCLFACLYVGQVVWKTWQCRGIVSENVWENCLLLAPCFGQHLCLIAYINSIIFSVILCHISLWLLHGCYCYCIIVLAWVAATWGRVLITVEDFQVPRQSGVYSVLTHAPADRQTDRYVMWHRDRRRSR